MKLTSILAFALVFLALDASAQPKLRIVTNVYTPTIMVNGKNAELVDDISDLIIKAPRGSENTIITVMKDGYENQTFTVNNHIRYNELSFDLIPVLESIDSDSAETIACTSVKFKIQPGTLIGGSWNKSDAELKEKFKKKLFWGETSSIAVDELEVLVNNDLDNIGYIVPSIKDKFKEGKGPRLILDIEIEGYEFNNYYNMFYSLGDQTCKMDIKWTIFDSKRNKVMLEKKTGTTTTGNELTEKLMIFKTLSASLKRFLTSDDVKEVLQKKSFSKTTEDFTKSVNIDAVKGPRKLSEAIESVVTVIVGSSHGSGFIISSEGYVLTNYHVVEEEKTVSVKLNSGVSLEAEVIRRNAESDLALLKLSGSGFKALPLSNVEGVIGADVMAVGTPGKIELGQSVSKGIISGRREMDEQIYLQTDVSVSPGNSGGPLLNSNNEVIGIINAKLVGKGIEGVGFAIPIEIALKKLNIIIK